MELTMYVLLFFFGLYALTMTIKFYIQRDVFTVSRNVFTILEFVSWWISIFIFSVSLGYLFG